MSSQLGQIERLIEPKAYLTQELMNRCKRNSSYSMRAFAQGLGMSASALSMVLSGKRQLSRLAAERIADKLGLDPETRRASL